MPAASTRWIPSASTRRQRAHAPSSEREHHESFPQTVQGVPRRTLRQLPRMGLPVALVAHLVFLQGQSLGRVVRCGLSPPPPLAVVVAAAQSLAEVGPAAVGDGAGPLDPGPARWPPRGLVAAPLS